MGSLKRVQPLPIPVERVAPPVLTKPAVAAQPIDAPRTQVRKTRDTRARVGGVKAVAAVVGPGTTRGSGSLDRRVTGRARRPALQQAAGSMALPDRKSSRAPITERIPLPGNIAPIKAPARVAGVVRAPEPPQKEHRDPRRAKAASEGPETVVDDRGGRAGRLKSGVPLSEGEARLTPETRDPLIPRAVQ